MEEEAKTKWCPFARIASPMVFRQPGSTREDWIGVAGANRGALSERIAVQGATDPSNPEAARCIGSACMAWRWHGVIDSVGRPYTGDLAARAAKTNNLSEGDVRMGHCGLAGQP